MTRKTAQTPILRSAFSMRKRGILAAWLGLVVLAFNLVATMLPMAPPSSDLLSSRFMVCTAYGMISVAVDGQQKETPAAPDPLCVFCLPLMHASVTETPTAPPLPPPPSSGEAVALASFVDDHLFPTLPPGAIGPRAPPMG